MAPLRLALLGCGDVAQRDYLPEFHRLAGRAELVAVCTRTPERLRWAQQHYQIPYGYTEFQQMLAEHAADAVINLTPIPLHDATNRAILEAGYHLYSEKPAARSARSARTLASLAHQHGLQALCAPSIRLFPQLQFVRQLLAEETIGPVHSAHGQGLFGVPPWEGYPSDPTPFFAAGAGPMLDMGVYPLHALTALLGPVRRVTALVARVQESFTVDTGPHTGLRVPIEAADHWQLLLDFGNACFAHVAANAVVVDTRSPAVELHGLAGTIAFDPIYVDQPVQLRRRSDSWQEIHPPFPPNPPGRSHGPDHLLGILHLLDCIEGRCEPLLGFEQAAHVLQIIEAAQESAATGCAVAID